MMGGDLTAIFRAGFVRRWHTNPDLAHTCDRIDGHGARVARIILAWHPDPSLELVKAALIHDDGESVVGDRPATFKRNCGEEWGEAMERTEYLASVNMWGHWQQPLGAHDLHWLKFADRLDAYMWAAHHAPHIMDRDGWPEAWEWLVEVAADLGCLARLLDTIGRPVGGGSRDAA